MNTCYFCSNTTDLIARYFPYISTNLITKCYFCPTCRDLYDTRRSHFKTKKEARAYQVAYRLTRGPRLEAKTTQT